MVTKYWMWKECVTNPDIALCAVAVVVEDGDEWRNISQATGKRYHTDLFRVGTAGTRMAWRQVKKCHVIKYFRNRGVNVDRSLL